jgi:Ca2+-binding RTX toxin-like protein
MKMRIVRFATIGSLVLLLAVVGSAVTAANTVPVSHVVDDARSIGANDLKPSDCSGITLTTLTTGSGIFTGSGAAELILASANVDAISGLGGNDCILGGGGGDTIDGGLGTDVCLGGPGTDVITCETSVQ